VAFRCRVPASPIVVTIQNISSDGCKIAVGHCKLQRGTTVLLEVSRDVHVLGRVLWTKLNLAGVKFESGLPAELLSAIIEGKTDTLAIEYTMQSDELADHRQPMPEARYRAAC
jgi:hypothetical protein